MKKLLFAVASLALGFGAFAQEGADTLAISKDVQPRNAVIEEYTGNLCTWCPDGHKRVSDFAKTYPGRVVPINIHTGGFAQLYETPYGSAIEGQTDLQGYPSGSVNRKINYNSKKVTAYDRGQWAAVGGNIMKEESPVNIAAKAEINGQTREMTVTVKVYYTKDLEQDFSLVNVLLMQNNILGPQTGMDKIVDGQYRHMHMLRDMITGQWGDTIAKDVVKKLSRIDTIMTTNVIDTVISDDNDTTYTYDTVYTYDSIYAIPAGTYIVKQYTYTVPETIKTDDSHSEVVFGDLDVVVFITDGHDADAPNIKGPNIWTGLTIEPSYTEMEGVGANITGVTLTPDVACKNAAFPIVTIRNNHSTTIESVELEYTNAATNSTVTYEWKGSVELFKTATIVCENPIEVESGKSNTVSVKIVKINGIEIEDAKASTAKITRSVANSGPAPIKITLKTDKNCSQISWTVVDSEGNVLKEGGHYEGSKIMRDTIILEDLADGCYSFVLVDEGNDGATSGNYKIYDALDNILASNTTGEWAGGEAADFKVGEVSLIDVNDNIFQSIVYPNPAKDMMTLSLNAVNSDNATINVVDLTGRTVINLGNQNIKSGENLININTSNLENGMYYVRVITRSGMVVNKFSVAK